MSVGLILIALVAVLWMALLFTDSKRGFKIAYSVLNLALIGVLAHGEFGSFALLTLAIMYDAVMVIEQVERMGQGPKEP